jgi:hypothetical protein
LRGETPAVAGSGISFDTFPQNGDWLYVESTNAGGGGGSPNGYGIELDSADSIGVFTGTLEISASQAATPAFSLHTNNGSQEYVAGLDITVQTQLFNVDSSAFGSTSEIILKTDNMLLSTVGVGATGAININSDNLLNLQSDSDNVQIIAGVGTVLTQAQTITFNATGGQKVAVATLANVIALLQSYGLAA